MKRSLWKEIRTALVGVTYTDRLGDLRAPAFVDLRATVVSPAELVSPIGGEPVSYYRLEIGARIDRSSQLPPGIAATQLYRFERLEEHESEVDLVVRDEGGAHLRLVAGAFVVVAPHPIEGQPLPRSAFEGPLGRKFAGRSVLDLPSYRETTLSPDDVVVLSAIVAPPSVRAGSAYRAGGGDDVLTLLPGQPTIRVEKIPRPSVR